MTRYEGQSALRGLLAAALLTLVYVPVSAQSPTTGAVTGVVADTVGEALGDVFVTLTDAQTGLVRESFTTRRGSFQFSFLPPGDYTLTIEKLGYSPRRLASIPVRAGRATRVDRTLPALNTSVGVLEETFASGAQRSSRGGAGQWVPELGARVMPSARRDVAELARLTSQASDDLVVEGLPPWLSALAIDGTPFRPAVHPAMWSAPFSTTAFALGGIGPAELVTNGLDMEWTGVAGAYLSGYSRRGAPALQAEARADWSGSVLPGASFLSGSSLSYNDVQGGVAVRAPVLADSARISVGLEVRRLQTPVSAAWPDSQAAAALVGSGAGAGLNLASYRSPAVAPADAVSAFGRFDWPVSTRHQLAGWLQLASLPRVSATDPFTAGIAELDGVDLIAGAAMASSLGSATGNDLRVSITTSSRNTTEPAAVASTMVVGDGLVFGGATAFAQAKETRVLVTDAVHYRSASRVLKAGISLAVSTHRYDYRERAGGEFLFGSVADLMARRGVLVRNEGPAAIASWTTPTFGVFAQHVWTASDGLELLLGARVEKEQLPTDQVTLDAQWETLSGLVNTAVEIPEWRPIARAGITWDVAQSGRWVLNAGAGISYDRIDPLLLSQWQIDAGAGRVTREIGAVSWPQPPAAGGGLRRLTLLAPDFDAPRTTRFSAGLVHQFSPHTSVHLSGVLRRTDHLPRRTDLNLLQFPVARDQYGRAVYGTLVQQGALLAAQAGSNRRFDSYDEVAGISADGRSDYWGLTIGLERDAASGVGVIARYTYGHATDNWFGGREGGWTAPLPQGLDAAGDWADGTSDFDIPHRAVAGVVLDAPFGATFSAVYRLQSGEPFTPGFRAGVDASGDGSPRQDPAFVDAAFSGMSALFSEWPCLRESSGRIARRNSCRGAAAHALDLSIALPVLQLGGGAAALMIDAFDLLEAARAQPDAALFLVDPAGQLTRDPVARTVSVPLLLNPNFGDELVRPHAGRKLRLGFSVTW